ncbi:hypothetical protein PVAP13_6KG065600 [Panicum virgatum]|uniref:Uncharacterized protein n=1 Tax=Panicum virgatum TaxID=38727 RepID=A0A8T0R9P7_PANVG|nr:hypothetical protein PVAP13_6KG065600 [Panicum virgatum]
MLTKARRASTVSKQCSTTTDKPKPELCRAPNNLASDPITLEAEVLRAKGRALRTRNHNFTSSTYQGSCFGKT